MESEQKYWELVFVVCGIGFVVFGGLIGGKTGYCDYEWEWLIIGSCMMLW